MTATARFGLGTIVRHRDFGGLEADGGSGDPELDRIAEVVRGVLGDHGWLDVDLELGKRWVGGTLRLVPGRDDAPPKDIPIEVFLKKLIGVRDKLRVLEQKLNGHASLTAEEKLELQGYITRCYGSLTTF